MIRTGQRIKTEDIVGKLNHSKKYHDEQIVTKKKFENTSVIRDIKETALERNIEDDIGD